MNLIEIEKEYLEKKLDGMEFSTIRTALENKGLNEDQVKWVIRSIDNKLINGAKKKVGNSLANELIYIGAALIGVGLFVTIGSYTGFIDMGNSYLILYGPIIAGIGMLLAGLNRRT